jgi:aerobic carbon-monoxide dehydrogenase medium subunit
MRLAYESMPLTAPEYHRADTVEQATTLLARFGDEAKVLAGGQSLVVLMNAGLVEAAALVDVDRIPGLSYVEPDGGGLRVGALTRHSEIERHGSDLGSFEVLRQATPHIAFPAVRARGTFAGVLAHADPTGEWCVLARTLDAEIVVQGEGGRRTIPCDQFFQGFLTTALEPDEVIVEVRFPPFEGRAHLEKVHAGHADLFTLVVAAACDSDGGRLRKPRVTLGGVATEPVRVGAVEESLDGAEADDAVFAEAGRLAAEAVERQSDAVGARYTRSVVAALAARSLRAAAGATL